MYLDYGWVTSIDAEPSSLEFHVIVAIFCQLSILSAVGLLALAQRQLLSRFVLISPWLFAAVYLNGKRYIFAILVILLWILVAQRGFFKRFNTLITGLILFLVLAFFSFGYQIFVRELRDYSEIYQNARIDYGRDAVVKMTIYAELHPTRMEILDYRGESLIFWSTLIVPRELWPDKPYPYSQYFTSAMLFISPRILGWGMTTSWLEEAIANFSWFGFLLGPLLPALICRIGDVRNDRFVRMLSVLVATLFLTVQLAAFASIAAVWVLMVCWAWLLKKRQTEVQEPVIAQ
ncbi:MAG: hypothetical protein GZ088_01870 [Acidipila sp.]|nr:hypothetical protein [Acidipila sp.]